MKCVGIIGVGKLGESVAKILENTSLFEVKRYDVREGFETFTASNAKECDVIVLTVPGKVIDKNLLDEIASIHSALIVASTSCDEDTLDVIKHVSKSYPVIMSSNFSEQMNKLFKLLDVLSTEIHFNDVLIKDIHHIHKKDVSGTARNIANILSSNLCTEEDDNSGNGAILSSNILYDSNCESVQFSFSGKQGKIAKAEQVIEDVFGVKKETSKKIDEAAYTKGTPVKEYMIGNVILKGVRYEDVPGKHYIQLEGKNITIKIEHIAKERSVFAEGICKLVTRINEFTPSLYDSIDIF